jgi:PAS domain S-box-containing protein
MEGLQITTEAGRPPEPREHLAHLFAMSPDLLAAAGFDGLLKLFNDAWEEQLGYSREELSTTPYLEFVHPEDREATLAQIARLADGEQVSEYVCRILHKDGSVRQVAWSGGPGGEAFYIVGRDVTERIALEEELASRAERLQRTNAELQDFAYTASHDLNEPLRTMTSYLGLLERRAARGLDPQGRELLGHATDGARRMRALIDDLLQYSRVANEPARREPVDLAAVLADVLDVLRPAIDEAGARIQASAMPTLEAERSQMAQLLQNLLANAIKFRGSRAPVVRVDAREGPGTWVLTVTDNGIGIAEADRERVFTMFTRLHDREQYAGTGIGLAICRRIAERHGGRIWVESTLGEGSVFYVLIPTRTG